MAFPDFAFAFWHPFGPHGKELAGEILERKQRKTRASDKGWTLWSFQYRRPEFLEWWRQALSTSGTGPVLALCSDSGGAVAPGGSPVDCTEYRGHDADDWLPVPSGVSVPHPFRGGRCVASAFVVKQVSRVASCAGPAVEWLSSTGWRPDPIPSRGEYLLRRGGGVSTRPVQATLHLCSPYVLYVRATGQASLR